MRCDCGGKLVLVAVVTEPGPIVEILTALALPTTAPVPAKARDPTLFDTDPPAPDDAA